MSTEDIQKRIKELEEDQIKLQDSLKSVKEKYNEAISSKEVNLPIYEMKNLSE